MKDNKGINKKIEIEGDVVNNSTIIYANKYVENVDGDLQLFDRLTSYFDMPKEYVIVNIYSLDGFGILNDILEKSTNLSHVTFDDLKVGFPLKGSEFNHSDFINVKLYDFKLKFTVDLKKPPKSKDSGVIVSFKHEIMED